MGSFAQITTPKQTVAFVNFSRAWGGGEMWHFTAAQALMQRHYTVTLLAVNEGALHYQAVQHGIPCLPFFITPHSFLNPLLLTQLFRSFQLARPSTILLNGSLELKTAGIAAKLAGVPRILYRRAIPRTIRPTWLNRFLFNYVVDQILVNSQTTRAAIHEIVARTKQAPPILLYNGIEEHLDEIGEPECADLHSHTIGVVARLSPEKGVDLAIQAFAHVVDTIPDARLLIVGDGPDREKLERLAAEHHLTEQVMFAGFVEQGSERLSECSIFVMPSRWEGFGFALLEAMLLKMPCVAFTGTAAEEIIQHGVTGYLAEAEEPRDLANYLITLLKSPEKRQQMARAGHTRARSQFGFAKMITQLEEILAASS